VTSGRAEVRCLRAREPVWFLNNAPAGFRKTVFSWSAPSGLDIAFQLTRESASKPSQRTYQSRGQEFGTSYRETRSMRRPLARHMFTDICITSLHNRSGMMCASCVREFDVSVARDVARLPHDSVNCLVFVEMGTATDWKSCLAPMGTPLGIRPVRRPESDPREGRSFYDDRTRRQQNR